MEKVVDLYLVSDSSGETVTAVARSVCVRFEGLDVREKIWPLVNSKKRLDDLMRSASKNKNSIILYTVFNIDLEQHLLDMCKNYNIRCISAIGHIMDFISTITGSMRISSGIPGIQHKAIYEKAIESISFSISHDDGKLAHECDNADIVLLGVSRTSKSPTSAYLAQKGYKVANIPIIQGITVNLEKITNPLIVGFTISPYILMHIRSSRGGMKLAYASYSDIRTIKSEIVDAEKLFMEKEIPTVDVSLKAIEEIAAEVLKLYFNKIRKR
ncbi:Phosphoenolpyruvate synthase regulatory protein [Candidatus Cyrtobacter comes]|uniref:Phosphoenolpyruvate synthase regulatory protein n=1 Tax=Candidatus Cyrtobacter comes TaxID=675776 RepID=A0ABU5L7I5_9RICK|nr:pyruvate, phosphate dikinase/phosphoenolpyruvate synthase regulator [Candidatus Cyrtobacter comes]MDZ5761855.1 Phosphoenolpyruvate synthase regulatory protein [Candidatus Cyrtobacter comes]